ncbi:hypothetical protein DEU56DRAFT_804512 [Suillus clintonianus]|uniref:uncharacterized protein n=1 Tax=Suillus clintonianus TaxID=1904413 RepID=UPI001B86124A|nr:uncharacterized protein DEU56DRAFT_804512 [Suillus clintonianus]KAG2137006.1 hypothetical protein DEU56DRAFT_804512 [Suillus clintonianus]
MVQMIAMTHLKIVTDFVDVPELDTCTLISTNMESVVAASAVALERALKLVADEEKKGAALKTPLKLNKATGKESSVLLSFSELNWGKFTQDYYQSLYTADIIKMAHKFLKDLNSEY